MNAFHSLWTKPSGAKTYNDYRMEDYDILTMILSALSWRKYNGKIRLITDTVGADYIYINKLDAIYDLGITKELDSIDKFDPFLFWAAGKLWALNTMSSPCVMIDTDLIIWKNINQILKENVIAAHDEELYDNIYPNIDVFKMTAKYKFSDEWDYTIKPSNTAFLYVPSDEFKDYYTDKAFEFMRNCRNNKVYSVSPTVSMCFAEQRLLAMCAKEKEVNVDYLLKSKGLDNQDFITHIWGYKTELRTSFDKREKFCRKCVKRIMEDYPEYSYLIEENRDLNYYL